MRLLIRYNNKTKHNEITSQKCLTEKKSVNLESMENIFQK